MAGMSFYCMRCKRKVTLSGETNVTEVRRKNKRGRGTTLLLKAKCPKCRKDIYRILGRA